MMTINKTPVLKLFIKIYSKKIIAMISLIFLLISAVPMNDKDPSSFPIISKLVSNFTAPSLMAASQVKIISGTVKKGDTASSLLNTYIPLKMIYDLENRSKKIFPFTKIREGQPFQISLLEDKLLEFDYEINLNDRLVIQQQEDSFSISKIPIEYEIKQEVLSVDIRTSLAEAVRKAGEYSSLTWKLADIFAWDIDFMRDIQPGDNFRVLVEKRYRGEKFFGYSDIQAAFFTNNGVEYKAFLHKDANGHMGYYNENGQSLEKAFLKAPLNYSRISSPFSPRRLHPILNKYRSHPGVDYAAPRNTPIKTVADGIIINIGYNNSMGRNIIIRHFNGYETSYFHMNKYAKGMKKNKKVSQGDVIGYVGKTGLATGYHLCFRMRKNGNPVNPLKQTIASAKPVSDEEMDLFSTKTMKYSEKIMAAQKLAHATP
jgi:murein DD-endopeptidase MepM/ murein hydrolase activator NlpD